MAFLQDQLITAEAINSANSGKQWRYSLPYSVNTKREYYPSSSGYWVHTEGSSAACYIKTTHQLFGGSIFKLQKQNSSGSWSDVASSDQGGTGVPGYEHKKTFNSNGPGKYRVYVDYTRCDNDSYLLIYYSQKNNKADRQIVVWVDPRKASTIDEVQDIPLTASNLNSGYAGTK